MNMGEIVAEIVFVAALTVGAGWLIWAMANAQEMRREDERAHGDVAHLPDELRRAAISSPGEGADQAARHGSHSQIPLIAPREPSV